MKHSTHIYLAVKAVELLKRSVDNLHYSNNRVVASSRKSKERRAATELQRIFNYHLSMIREATWAPDDILHDNDPNHIFKLFTNEEFPNHGLEDVKQKIVRDGVIY
ncbi:MAG: hypothetical protein P9X24_18825 [Candidatus Hatepunaea meridiana]|nr:hypothetical protein [Candidatus Hatepunaea meridiana]